MRFRAVPTLLAATLLASCTSEPAPTPEPEPRTYTYVALGDSFAAMGSRSAPTSGPTECFRSADNYPALVLADARVTAGTDASCSSAVTADIDGQATALTPDTTLVTLSIGGNDIRFGDIAGCMRLAMNGQVPSCATALGTSVRERLDALPADLNRVYELIAERSPEARIITTGYLPLLAAGQCPELSQVTASDRDWAVTLSGEINDVVRAAAERHGAEFVLPGGVEKHTTCAKPAQRWADVTGLQTDAYPMHPTPAGQEAMAAAVIDQISK